MKKDKNIIVFLAVVIIILNVYLIFTNFNLNRQFTAISYISPHKEDENINVYQSNIKNLKKIFENSSQESLSLINIITISDNHVNFEAEAETLDEIEKLHIYLSKIYYDNKNTVNITRQNENYKALFEYNNQS